MPIIFDLKEMTVTFADLAIGTRGFTNMRSSNNKFVAATRSVLDLVNTKTTLYDVLSKQAAYCGKQVKTPDKADIVYDADDENLVEVAEKLLSR